MCSSPVGLGAKRVTIVMEGAMLAALTVGIATRARDAYTCALILAGG